MLLYKTQYRTFLHWWRGVLLHSPTFNFCAQLTFSLGTFTGILTKPDLVDRGTEESIVNIVRNLVIPLKKGYMIVKCRGQQDIHNKVALAAAIQQERKFFETHKHFRYFSQKGPKQKHIKVTSKLPVDLLRFKLGFQTGIN